MVTSDKISYNKKPLSINDQIMRLIQRGLIVEDKNEASGYLSNISYYRLRAYTYPFQNNEDGQDHVFIRDNIHFKDIVELYCFDRRLRLLLFNAIEKIEVALRTKIVQVYAESTDDSHWYNDKTLYRSGFEDLISHIKTEVDRSNEDFIKHYNDRYNEPEMPPSWMALEVVSFTTLSRLYHALIEDNRKMSIATHFGLKKVPIMENWLHSISNLRNCCAHHSRIWNRRFVVNMIVSYNTLYPFISKKDVGRIRANKLFAIISSIAYILDRISPGSDFKSNIKKLLSSKCNLLDMADMGFPNNWQDFPIWNK